MHIEINRSNSNRRFRDCEYYEFDNVSAVQYFNCESRAVVHFHNDVVSLPQYKYIVCEAPGSPAFAHWVCEFLYPNLPLLQHFICDPDFYYVLFDEPKRYMINFLVRIGVPRSMILLASDRDNGHIQVNGVKGVTFLKHANRVICPHLYSLNNIGIPKEEWTRQLLNSKMLLPKETPGKTIPFVLLKRNSKDNFTSRPVADGYGTLEDWVVNNDGVLVDGYMVNNIPLQESIVHDSRVIITNSGSSYLINGIMSTGSIIVVIDENHLSPQFGTYPGMKAIDDFIRTYNTVHVFTDVRSTLEALSFMI